MISCVKPDLKMFFFNNVFGYDEYFSSYSRKKVCEFCVEKIRLDWLRNLNFNKNRNTSEDTNIVD